MGAGGRPRNLESPEQLFELFEAYKLNLIEQAREWPKIQYVGKDGIRVEDYPKLPLTIEGLYTYAYKQGYGIIKQYFKADSAEFPEFLPICSCIKNEVRENQIMGGLINVFNPSITQRLNNLAEKVEGSVELKQITGMEVK